MSSNLFQYHSSFINSRGEHLKEEVEADKDTGVIVYKVDGPDGHYDVVYNPKQVSHGFSIA